ncbi:MAG: HupE/UreJ family protein [Gemmatimonadota bacterium]
MLSELITYFRLGASHIADLRGYDHILFIVALTAGYAWRDWRRLLWLVTAFTVGHSVTLALATIRVVRVEGPLVEALIAITIVATGLYGLTRRSGATDGQERRGGDKLLYAMAGAFGLIHGLGFSSFLRSLLGAEENILLPLLGFNVGLEAGQLAIVFVVLLAGTLVCDLIGLLRRWWSSGLSAAAVGLGLMMIVERLS